jgi:HSP20 family protein
MSTALAKPQSQTPAPASRNPFALLRKEMDDLVSRFWDGEPDRWLTPTFAPSADLTEADNAFEIRMDVPGMDAKDINVQVHGNAVTISGERKEVKEEKGKTFHRIERRSGSFARTLTLPCEVNEDEVAAEYVQGVLTLTLPKCETAKVKKVAVKG